MRLGSIVVVTAGNASAGRDNGTASGQRTRAGQCDHGAITLTAEVCNRAADDGRRTRRPGSADGEHHGAGAKWQRERDLCGDDGDELGTGNATGFSVVRRGRSATVATTRSTTGAALADRHRR
jgi:hypothetical protein